MPLSGLHVPLFSPPPDPRIEQERQRQYAETVMTQTSGAASGSSDSGSVYSQYGGYDTTEFEGRGYSPVPTATAPPYVAENLQQPETPNLHSYVGSNPVNYVDPTGQFSVVVAVRLVTQAVQATSAADALGFLLVPAVTIPAMVIGDILFSPVKGYAYECEYNGTCYSDGVWSQDGTPVIKPGTAGGTTAGQDFTKDVRDKAKEEDPSQTCVYCGQEGVGTDLDHAFPKSKGGDATIDNAQWACPHCNRSKGNRQYPKTPPDGYTGPWPPPWWPVITED